MTRESFVIANWKMYKTAHEAADYIAHLIPQIEGCKSNVWLAVPFTSIAPSVRAAKQSAIAIGAQNMNDAREGAFTGEIASLMLKEAGASFVLLGHSERRTHFGEDDKMVQRKVMRALQDDLRPVLCVGETLAEREAGEMEAVLMRQILSALEGIEVEDASKILLAYEPVWAIGTGLAASPALAQEAHNFCRTVLEGLVGKRAAGKVPILYGGSVQPQNAKSFCSQKDIDGVLVGGASLDPTTLAKIISNCVEK